MPTPLIWKVLHWNFLSNLYLCRIPITFEYDDNSSRHKFHFEKVLENYRKFLVWMFNVFFLFTILTVGCCGYVIVRHAYQPIRAVTTVHILIYAIITPTALLTAAISLFVIYSGEVITRRMNCFTNFFDEVNRLDSYTRFDSSKINKYPIWKTSDGDFDFLGILLFCLNAPLVFLPYINVVFGTLARINVYPYVLYDILPQRIIDNSLIKLIIELISALICLICWTEGVRMIPFLIMFLMIPFQLTLRSLKMLQHWRATDFRNVYSKDYHFKYTNLVYTQYVRLQLIMISGQDEDAQSVFILMVLGAVISSLANFCTIRLLNVKLPILFYSVFPMASIAILIIVQQMLPVAVGVNEKASEAREKWIGGLNTAKLKGSERKLLSMRLSVLSVKIDSVSWRVEWLLLFCCG
ncbi:hypothetical protein Fcan01_08881 [Folsomia candida]|uniref:Uncharacterized protein n=1 Tax=Folsomia candida TaxID=158441 RepID=A0A226EG87_FOLCA|nr:hypothetical protein Fcan01_08881 [Folsomia candida]